MNADRLYRLLFEPKSIADEDRRREFMVNVLLCGVACLTATKLLLSLSTNLQLGFDQEEDALLLHGLFLALILVIWRVSRTGHRQLAAISLLGVLIFEALRVTLSWSFELPAAQLMYAVVIVAAGVVLTAGTALIVTAFTSLLMLGIGYAQITGYLRPHTFWLQRDFQFWDVFGYVAVLCVIALITWLTNREMSQSLARAHASEAALAKERDNLEIIVAERTLALQQSQLLRDRELDRFAEFGRVSASLLHDVANPLTAAALNLETCAARESRNIRRARQNLHQLERYIEAARLQLKDHRMLRWFGIRGEFQKLALVMDSQARRHQLQLTFTADEAYKIYGDPVKFNQIMANLVANAIDAYDDVMPAADQRIITVHAGASARLITITVTDHGTGIAVDALPHIFDPFYTTKAETERGSGIGLTMVRRVVEQDFGGSITASSSPARGTRFTIKLRRISHGQKAVASYQNRRAQRPADHRLERAVTASGWLRQPASH